MVSRSSFRLAFSSAAFARREELDLVMGFLPRREDPLAQERNVDRVSGHDLPDKERLKPESFRAGTKGLIEGGEKPQDVRALDQDELAEMGLTPFLYVFLENPGLLSQL